MLTKQIAWNAFSYSLFLGREKHSQFLGKEVAKETILFYIFDFIKIVLKMYFATSRLNAATYFIFWIEI